MSFEGQLANFIKEYLGIISLAGGVIAFLYDKSRTEGKNKAKMDAQDSRIEAIEKTHIVIFNKIDTLVEKLGKTNENVASIASKLDTIINLYKNGQK